MIVPGVAGVALTVTTRVWVGDEPHELFALTVMLPLDRLAVVAMVLVLDDPVQPRGSDQV